MTTLLKAQALAKLNDAEDKFCDAHRAFATLCNDIAEGCYNHLPRRQIDWEMGDRAFLYAKARHKRDKARKAYDALSREQARAMARAAE